MHFISRSKINIIEPINGSSHLFTSNHNVKLPLKLVMHGFSVLKTFNSGNVPALWLMPRKASKE